MLLNWRGITEVEGVLVRAGSAEGEGLLDSEDNVE